MRKSAQRRRKHCALAVVRQSQKISPRRRPNIGSSVYHSSYCYYTDHATRVGVIKNDDYAARPIGCNMQCFPPSYVRPAFAPVSQGGN